MWNGTLGSLMKIKQTWQSKNRQHLVKIETSYNLSTSHISMQCSVRIIPNEKPWQLPGHFVDICQQQRQQTGEVHGDKPQIQELWRLVIFASVKVRAAEIPA